MSSRVNWGNSEETILIMKFGQHWEINDFHQMRRELDTLQSGKNHPVDVIIDLQESVLYPLNLIRLSRENLNRIHPNTRYIVLVTNNTFLQQLYHTARTVIPKMQNVKLFSSMNEAYRMLANDPISIPQQVVSVK